MSRIETPRLLGPSGVVFVARAMALATGVATVLLASHLLGPDGRGRLATYSVAQFIGSAILGIGTGSAAYVVVQRRDLPPGAVAGVLVVWAAIVACVVALVGIVLVAGSGTGRPLPAVDLYAMGLLVIGIPAQFLAAGLTGLAMGGGRIRATAVGYSAAPVAALLGTGGAAVLGAPIEGYLAVQAASYVAASVALLAAVDRPSRPTPKMVKRLFRVARPAAVGDFSNALSYRLDVLVLGALAGANAVGIYSLAVQILEPIWLIATAASSGLLITLVHAPVEVWAKKTTATTQRVVVGTIAGVTLVLIVMPVVVAIVGRSFAQTPMTALLLAPGVVALAGSKVLAAGQTAAGRLWLGSVIATSSVVVTTGFDIALIPIWGPLGASVASSAGYGSSLVLWILATRRFGSRPEVSPALTG